MFAATDFGWFIAFLFDMAASYQPVPLREDEPAASQEPPRSKRATIAAASLVMCAVGATLAVGTNNGVR
jgi:hypothetical protein